MTDPEAAERIILAERGRVQPEEIKKPPFRLLTPGEVALVQSVFRNVMNVSGVKIYDGKKIDVWQSDNRIMAPDGNIYIPSGRPYPSDFSTEPLSYQAVFIHEMTHVWQHLVEGRGLFMFFVGYLANSNYAYIPTLKNGTFSGVFNDYGIEEQASIVEDYFLIRNGHSVSGAPPISDYWSLIPFVPATGP